MNNIIDDSMDYTRNLFANPIFKVAGAEATILINIYNDARMAILTIICLVITDTVFGMMIAAKFGNLSSWRFRKSMYKLLFYLIVVFIGSLAYVVWGVPWVKEAFIGLIISTEILSIMENLEMNFPGIIPKAIITRLKLSIHKKKSKHCE